MANNLFFVRWLLDLSGGDIHQSEDLVEAGRTLATWQRHGVLTYQLESTGGAYYRPMMADEAAAAASEGVTVDRTGDPFGSGRVDSRGRDLVPCGSHAATCLARSEPETFGEFVLALRHSEDHSFLSGCSHGR